MHEAIAFHTSQGYTIIGITNQGGCDTINRDTGKPLKSLEDALAQLAVGIAEQEYTLSLIPQLECIYFCPDMKGFVCYRVTRNNVAKISDHRENNGEFFSQGETLRHSVALASHLPKGDAKGDSEALASHRASRASGGFHATFFKPGNPSNGVAPHEQLLLMKGEAIKQQATPT